jgi:subtilase family serine protease
MRPKYLFSALIVLILALLPFLSARVSGQTGSVPSRISAAVDNTQLMVLRGNTHPMARAEFDRGPAPASLPMDHMLLVLTRSPQQESALETLLAQQQDRASPNYHKWLTPEQFGQQFGPSDQDIQTITSWLQSNGFQVNGVANGRTTIDFSGTAGAVQQAFHTAIHSYVLANGEQHWANSTDPQIPVALAPVVAGVNSMNNFRRRPLHTSRGVVRKDLRTGKFARVSPQFTFAGEPYEFCNGASGTSNCWAVGPGDFNTIYNVPSTVNGTGAGAGQTIAIVSDSDIYASDVTAFRNIFGLPAATVTTNNSPACPSNSPCFDQIETGADPGVLNNQNNSDEVEAVLDVEWSGAVAPYATLDLVVSPTSANGATFGGDVSAAYIINCPTAGTNCPVAVPASVLSYSYGTCELELGTSLNQMYNRIWQQAAAEGITVVIATGDSGSAGCDDPSENQPAEFGLAVSGEASTPYNVAVGGTDFNDLNNPTNYWNNVAGALSSAKGYIPETSYNDSCTNSIIYAALGFSSAEVFCNSATAQNDGFLAPAGGGGGASNCTAPTGPSPSNCAGGYAKPSWQTGPGVPNDGKRDIPDVSLFAGDGTIQNSYIVCEADQDLGNAPCSLTPVPAAQVGGNYYVDFVEEGGTSVSTQAFAGVVALIDQKLGGKQGNINPMLYALASGQSASSIFHDVTLGTNAMPCIVISGTQGCSTAGVSNPTSATVGVLTGYNTGTGYDLATGLGSINIGNLVNNAGPNFYLSASNPVVTISSPGASGTMTVTAYPVSGYTGTVTLACSNLPPAATCSFSPASVVFTSSTSATTGIPVTVTVNTTSASRFIPFGHPRNTIKWAAAGLISFAAVIFLSMLFVGGPQRRQLGWSLAGLLLVLSVATALAACGGGSTTSSSSTTTTNNGTTGSFSSVLTGTASSGSPVSSMSFTVTVQ